MKQKKYYRFYKIGFWFFACLYTLMAILPISYSNRNYEKLNHIEELYGKILDVHNKKRVRSDSLED